LGNALARDMRRLVRMRGIGRRFVYILRSAADAGSHYVGVASDVDERLEWHNGGPSGYTRRHRPWRVLVSLEFPDEAAAIRFEKYLKSGSGRAFAKRHFGADHDVAEAPT
jgi:putative endonuclease